MYKRQFVALSCLIVAASYDLYHSKMQVVMSVARHNKKHNYYYRTTLITASHKLQFK